MSWDNVMTRTAYILAPLLVVAGPSLCLAAEEGEQGYVFFGDLAFWSLVTFVGFVWAIRKLGWQSFVDGLTERERKENEAIELAENKNHLAQQQLIDRKGQLEAIDETTREFIDEAHRDAERTRADIAASARSESETLKKRALREIERTRDQSLKGLFDLMAMRVIERTEERLSSTLTAADQERLMDESLTEFTAGSPR
jgi:F0F1-type ATP synthase membrane subunit b/b'